MNQAGAEEGQARAASFIALVSGHLALAPAVLIATGRGASARPRWTFWIVAGGALLLLALTLAVPELRDIMRFSLPDPVQLTAALAVGCMAGGWYAVRAVFGRRPAPAGAAA
jgi:hypothetical protein